MSLSFDSNLAKVMETLWPSSEDEERGDSNNNSSSFAMRRNDDDIDDQENIFKGFYALEAPQKIEHIVVASYEWTKEKGVNTLSFLMAIESHYNQEEQVWQKDRRAKLLKKAMKDFSAKTDDKYNRVKLAQSFESWDELIFIIKSLRYNNEMHKWLLVKSNQDSLLLQLKNSYKTLTDNFLLRGGNIMDCKDLFDIADIANNSESAFTVVDLSRKIKETCFENEHGKIINKDEEIRIVTLLVKNGLSVEECRDALISEFHLGLPKCNNHNSKNGTATLTLKCSLHKNKGGKNGACATTFNSVSDGDSDDD